MDLLIGIAAGLVLAVLLALFTVAGIFWWLFQDWRRLGFG